MSMAAAPPPGARLAGMRRRPRIPAGRRTRKGLPGGRRDARRGARARHVSLRPLMTDATETPQVRTTPHTRTASYLAEPGEVGRVLLLYSGGLDTSVMLKWIQDEYEAEVVALTIN